MGHLRLLVVLAVLLAYCAAVLAHSECRVAPRFWCDDPQVAKECGVTEQCASFQRSTANTPVEFTLYYESLCPDCKQMFEYQISSAYQKIGNIMNINLVPYGNAREYYDYNRRQWTFYCQHGQQECVGNLIETCAMDIYKNATNFFPFVSCMEMSSYYQPKDAAIVCAGQYKLDIQAILTCSTSARGNELEHAMALKTDALNPRHQYVPWVTVNGVHTQQIQQMAMSNLVGLICSTYTGSPKPAACTY